MLISIVLFKVNVSIDFGKSKKPEIKILSVILPYLLTKNAATFILFKIIELS